MNIVDPFAMPFSYESLFEPFYAAMKPSSDWLIGIEAEKFGVHRETGAALPYSGAVSIEAILRELELRYGWCPVSEYEGGPAIALSRGDTVISLEPAGQLELSGRPCHDVHQVIAEMADHLMELASLNVTAEVSWLGIGYHPFARREDLSWVPKLRYGVMRAYLPTRGSRALDMMSRTATVQANFDYSSEEDAMRKMRLALKLSPIVTAMMANSPFVEGQLGPRRSERAAVWLDVDPDRQGLLPRLWDPRSTLRDYVEWALDVPMFLIKRGPQAFVNSGQTFRSFLEEGFQGQRATAADWENHLRSLFPEVRLKRTLEVRGADSVPLPYAAALPAFWTGILYDARAMAEAEALVEVLEYEPMQSLRPAIARSGLSARLERGRLADLAERLMDVSNGGLARRRRCLASGVDESTYLAPLARLLGKGQCPADELLEGLPEQPVAMRNTIMERSRLVPA